MSMDRPCIAIEGQSHALFDTQSYLTLCGLPVLGRPVLEVPAGHRVSCDHCWAVHQDPTTSWSLRPPPVKACQVEGCEFHPVARGEFAGRYCLRHANLLRRWGSLDGPTDQQREEYTQSAREKARAAKAARRPKELERQRQRRMDHSGARDVINHLKDPRTGQPWSDGYGDAWG